MRLIHSDMINKFLFLTLPVILIFSACQEEIDLKLKDEEPRIVIEGNLSDEVRNQVVRISKTIPFTNDNEFNGFSGAKVILTTEDGFKINFREQRPGIYLSPPLAGIPGLKYQLHVTADGKDYSATSVMPEPVVLDSVTFDKITFLGNSNIYPVANYRDPISLQNQYLFLLKMNNKVMESIVTEDRFNNGNLIKDVLLYELEDYLPGDSLEVEMQCIDRNVFKYYFAIKQVSGQNGPPVAPENPISNFNNGALGIFSAHTSSRVKVVFR